ncbi:hypothetical protein KBX34_21370 [Micromonospora sp. M61]|nr:hypothetical protein [Micromonospora sp. M61]MBQ0980626.1 hypothetical protein [Micromonospora sp. M61]
MDEFADDHQPAEIESIGEGAGEGTQEGRREISDKQQQGDRQCLARRLGDVEHQRDKAE